VVNLTHIKSHLIVRAKLKPQLTAVGAVLTVHFVTHHPYECTKAFAVPKASGGTRHVAA